MFRIFKRRFEAQGPSPDPPARDTDDEESRARGLKRELGMPYCSAVDDSSAVLGYRPCAATSNIVDYSIARRKPFAILPCCAYPVDGASVKGLHDFADKLQKKHASIQRTVVGGSLVLYSLFDTPPPPAKRKRLAIQETAAPTHVR